jgi:large subunit ribosomal protein L7/L12
MLSLSRLAAAVTSSRHLGLCWRIADGPSLRLFSTPAGSEEVSKADKADEPDQAGMEKVQKLADQIVGLTVLECSWLSEKLRKKLNMQKPAYGSMQAMAMPSAAPAAAAAPEKKEEVVKEKTEFNIKLESFSADGKIKVIKEVRAITSLGLKEAKELVGAVTHMALTSSTFYNRL